MLISFAGGCCCFQNSDFKLLGSSVVERSAVNRLVVGSSPTRAAIFLFRLSSAQVINLEREGVLAVSVDRI